MVDLESLFERRTEREWAEYARKLDQNPTLQACETALAAQSPFYWIWHPLRWVWTKDEYDEKVAYKPFPHEPALVEILEEIHEHPVTFIAKSRQLSVTWLMCAYLCWWARFRDSQLCMIQSKKEDDAANLVYAKEAGVGRIDFIEGRLPFWMQVPRLNAFGEIVYRHNGSKIMGVPQGGDIVRSNTVSLYFGDEAAFQPEFKNAYRAAKQCARKIVAVSSAEPSDFGLMGEFQPPITMGTVS